MCGRTTLTITPDDLQRTFGFPAPADYRPRYNIAPSQELLAFGNTGSGVGLTYYRWGLVPFWASDRSVGNRMINARGETVATKPAYRAAFAKRRCLIVVDGFYEWQAAAGGKRPHRLCLATRKAFTLAGIWDRWQRGTEVIESCSIITTQANALMRPIHERMPVIVAPEEREVWLTEGTSRERLASLLIPYRGDDLIAYEVATVVNRPTNDSPECIEPIAGRVPLPNRTR